MRKKNRRILGQIIMLIICCVGLLIVTRLIGISEKTRDIISYVIGTIGGMVVCYKAGIAIMNEAKEN